MRHSAKMLLSVLYAVNDKVGVREDSKQQQNECIVKISNSCDAVCVYIFSQYLRLHLDGSSASY